MATRDRSSLGPSGDASRPFTVKQLLEQPLTDGACAFNPHYCKSHPPAAISQILSVQKALNETTEDRRQSVVSSPALALKLARKQS